MSDDNLETLDNVSLRQKCLEFGLPNVPITDTSRKVLIRRLRAVMTGEPTDKNKKRRETIHVSKIESKETAPVVKEAPKRPPSAKNRRTIAATNVTSTVDDNTLPAATKTVADVKRVRKVRSQIEQDAPVSIPVSQKLNPSVVLLEDDESEDDVIHKEIEVVIPRTRRSVSLSKTGVVTTSYSQEKVIVPPTVNETESESDCDFTSNYANAYESLTGVTKSYSPQTAIAPPTVSETESGSDYDFTSKYANAYEPLTKPRDTSYGLFHRNPEPRSSLSKTTVNRISIDAEPQYSSIRPNYSTNNKSEYWATTDLTTGDDTEKTPFLSDFAKTLERLKAEPLRTSVESSRHIPIRREPQTSIKNYQPLIGRQRGTAQKDSIADSFRNLLIVLDRKYNLKRNFGILFAIILLLFIFIVFLR